MSKRYPGGYLTASPVTPTATAAPGVWTLEQQYQAQGAGNWPAAANYQINKSLRFRSSASAYLSRTPASAGSQTTWTFSAWVKRGSLDSAGTYTLLNCADSGGNNRTIIDYEGTGAIAFFYFDGTTYSPALTTTALYRDPAAWYHIMVVYNSTQATSTNRVSIYVNGTQVTSFSSATYPSQNATTTLNSTQTHNIGRRVTYNDRYFDGEMAEINFIDGVAWTPSSFGTTDAYGIWQPIPYAGAYGTNGFYLPFTNTTSTTTLGYDSSGNGNNWTTNNFSLTSGTTYDSMYDSPTNNSSTVANYCVMNPVSRGSGDTTATFSDGNLVLTANSGAPPTQSEFYATIASPSTGKFYAECVFNQVFGTDPWVWPSFGIFGHLISGQGIVDWTTASSFGRFSNNDVCMMAWDVDNGLIWWGRNGTWFNSGNPAAGTGSLASFTYSASNALPFVGHYFSTTGSKSTCNFGQQPFTYTPPTGFLPLNTYNLPDSVVPVGNRVMDATLWTGNGSTQSITNTAGIKPDLVWLKQRSGVTWHNLYDSVRGVTKSLASNATDAEDTRVTGLTAFNSNGFSLGSDNNANGNTNTYVGWQWQAGQGTTSSNTNGSITSTVSVNPTAGFSVVGWTGTGSVGTLGHGLGVAPSMIFGKRRDGVSNWFVYHTSLGATAGMNLNTTDAASTNSGWWNNTAPTSSVFTMGSYETNSGSPFIAYCFAPVAGFSAFGSYTGNGSTDGPFVYTGFRPRWIMYKRSDSTSNWQMIDTAINTYNNAGTDLFANLSNAETSGYSFDILSNGFKQRDNGAGQNANGGTYIYAAFAENPFKMARAR